MSETYLWRKAHYGPLRIPGFDLIHVESGEIVNGVFEYEGRWKITHGSSKEFVSANSAMRGADVLHPGAGAASFNVPAEDLQ